MNELADDMTMPVERTSSVVYRIRQDDRVDELSEFFDDLTVIGGGGSSVVYRGRSNERTVVVKLISPGHPWKREVAMLTHVQENTAYPVGHFEVLRLRSGRVALVLEWLGDDWVVLDRLVGRLNGDEVATLTAELFSAVALLHADGIYHRDIKPPNILFNRTLGKTRLIDFGVACRSRDRAVGCSGRTFVGTPTFMPLRLLRSGSDAGSARLQDLWGVAATLFNAVTGMTLYQNADLDTVEQILRVPTREVLTAAFRNPEWLDWAVSTPGPASVVERILWSGAD